MMIDQINTILEEAAKDATLAKNLAVLLRQIYDEMIAVGFTEEQVMTIISNLKVGK